MTIIDKIRLLVKRYPKIYSGRKLEVSVLKDIYSKVTTDKIVVFCMSKDYMAYIFTSYVAKLGKRPFAELLSTQELVDIYIGASDEYSGISSINSDLVMVYDGLGMPNKQKGNLIVQVMEAQRIVNKNFILFYYGSESQFLSQYPEIKKELDVFGYKIISIGESVKNDEEIF